MLEKLKNLGQLCQSALQKKIELQNEYQNSRFPNITPERRRKIKFIYFLIFSVISILILCFPTANALGKEILEGMVDDLNNGVTDSIRSVINRDKVDLITGSAVVRTVYHLIAAGGGFLCIVYGLTRIFANMDRGMDPVESVFKTMRELCIVGIFMVNLTPIMRGLTDIGLWGIDVALQGADASNFTITNGSSGYTLTLDDFTGDPGLIFGPIDWMKAFSVLVIPWIFTKIMSVIAKFICYSIILEIGLRLAFAPLAVADIYGEGLRSPGMRYMKRYVATFLKAAIALASAALVNVFITTVNSVTGITGAWSFVFEMVAVGFTCITIMTRGGEIVNDVMGV